MKPNPWSEAEDAEIIADYLAMLSAQNRGMPVNKSATRRALLPKLNGRSEGSVEFKRCNVSAVLASLGVPYLKGYLPCANYQKRLADMVSARLAVSAPQPSAVCAA